MNKLMNGHGPTIDYTELLSSEKMIESEDENSLYRCLHDFIAEEVLTGQNAYECENCCMDKKVSCLPKKPGYWDELIGILCCKYQKVVLEILWARF